MMSRQVTSAFSRRSSRKHSSGRQRRYQQHLTPNYEPPTDESVQDESIRPLLSQNSAAEDFARHHSIELSSTSPNPNGLDQTENDVSAVERDSENELEQYEMDDRISEMPIAFTRRQRREGLFTPSRNLRSETTWEANELLASNHIQKSLNDEYLSDGGSRDRDMLGEEIVEESGMRKYAKLILPHVGLVTLTLSYTVLGAFFFFCIENPHEKSTKRSQLDKIYERQDNFVAALLELAGRNETSQAIWKQVADDHLHNLSDHFFIAYEKIFLTAEEVKRNTPIEIWTFSTAIFFSVSVVTTIGYGNPVPTSSFGRIMCIVFSLFGIPLTLVTIADLGKFLSENLIWLYGFYLHFKHYFFKRVEMHRERREHVCSNCQHSGLSPNAQIIEENKIPSMVVFAILVLYTALGGVLMSHLESWSFSTSFYWSFISLTTVGFGDLMPRRDHYMYIILVYIVLGLSITTMCIDLVGVQYIRKIHYFGRKIQDARSALAVVGGKVVLVSELYANLMQKRARNSARDAFVIENLYVSKHVIPFIPSDIRWIKYIDQAEQMSRTNSISSLDLHSSCRFCHSRFSVSNSQLTQ